MKKGKKDFDCVKMKNEIQRKMLEEEKKLGKVAYRQKTNDWFENSEDDLAVFWRKISEQHSQYK